MYETVYKNYFSCDITCRAVNLPSYHDMADDDIDKVLSVLCLGEK